MSAHDDDLRARALAVHERLCAAYGCPIPFFSSSDPLRHLVSSLLSHRTKNADTKRAFERLLARFPTWEAVRDAPADEIEEAIRPGGLAPTKAVRIQEILRALDGDDLSELADEPLADARARLTALPGVGRKTAACVLMFSFGRPDIPVDTHVYRVGTRLGLFRPGAPFGELHDDMLALTPRGQELEFHVNLLRHGRRTCHAQRPRCPQCVLRRICPSSRA